MDNISFREEQIQEWIRKKRMELVVLVAENGLKDQEVLKCSQELDLLVYQMQVLDIKGLERKFNDCQKNQGGY